MVARRRLKLVGVTVLAALVMVFWSRSERPATPTEVAYRICGECGLDVAEVYRLIEDMRHSTLSREENLELFRDTFERREDAELCIDCAEAVLDAAGR